GLVVPSLPPSDSLAAWTVSNWRARRNSSVSQVAHLLGCLLQKKTDDRDADNQYEQTDGRVGSAPTQCRDETLSKERDYDRSGAESEHGEPQCQTSSLVEPR